MPAISGSERNSKLVKNDEYASHKFQCMIIAACEWLILNCECADIKVY